MMSARTKLREDDGKVFRAAKSHGAMGSYGVKCKYKGDAHIAFVRLHGIQSIIKHGRIVKKQRYLCMKCNRTFTIPDDK